MDNKDIARELGRAGGNKTLKRHGKEHFRKISKKRWDKEKEKTEIPQD